MMKAVPLSAGPADLRNGTVIDIWYVNTRHGGLS